ncbi:LPXTG cell wall anchor domain-containing protein [Streptococcus suis]|uniref:LPXTG cell wall anchor domain-containing protein n=1 Tax=Streptococcus suis TaxID=1307 RepID=UPI002162DFA9|nr:LPXTG cell wall anchor domain-containing protein [Streptococcus suis]MCS0685099.1 LPXTG cell wall anchor domain-containing protein [Streptococcus suis]HEL1986779.1 LPXTG cell wall anchor domain-containing protein [Streptococcus suis]HEL2232394.1 LPXTG cell wall anchor domain-containing protein [Streptococcus suis]
MSKQKVVSSLLLSTVVLGGLAFYSTTTVKAESLEPDVTSVSSSDATNKLVVSNEEESDFLAEEELEDDETLEEELNEQAEEVAEPSSPEALLQPRAVMSDSMSSDMEEIQVKDEPSDNTAEKVEKQQSPLIQTSNADSKTGGDRETIKKSVTVNLLNAEEGQIQWEVRFDTSAWSFKESPGGFYFVLPKGLELTEIIDNDHGKMNIINNFPKNVNVPENAAKKKYRFFSEEEDQGSFNDQWGWSVGQATPDTTVNSWKSDNRFSKIYFGDQITDTTQVTYTLTAKVTASDQKSFPLMAVMKSFGYKNHSWTEFTSLGARMITLEKEKTLPPKEEAPKPELEAPKPEMPEAPQVPEEQPKDTPAPEVPLVPEEKPMGPEVDKPKPEAPQAPSTPEEKPQVPEAPKQEDVQPEAPKSDEVESDKQMPETKKPDMKQPKADDMPKEQQPKAEVPKAEQPQMDKPQMEAPKKDSEAPKSDKAETDKPMPETKKPDMKQPKADDMPKEQQPKAEAPKAEQPQMDKPQMEAPKKDSEAPKSDKAETDKPMSETKQPDMKQPKADKPEAEKAQMPRTEGMKPESKASMMPKAEAPKATLPNTGEASSAIGWLGGALATLATGLYLFKNKKEE